MARNESGYTGQSVMAGGDGGVAPPSDIAGESGAQITAQNIAGSTQGGDTSYARSRAGLDVESDFTDPRSEVGDKEVYEFRARDGAAAKANVVTAKTDTAEAAYANPEDFASAEGQTRMRAEAADRKPDAAVRAEEGVETANEARGVASNPEGAAADALRDIADDKAANVKADVGVNVTTKKPD